MATFDAVAVGGIPANRFMNTTFVDGDPSKLGVQLTEAGNYPDFYSKQSFKDGDSMTLTIGASENIWSVEAAEDLKAGALVVAGTDGTAAIRSTAEGSDLESSGVAMTQATKGNTVELWYHPRMNGPVATSIQQRISALESGGGSGGGGSGGGGSGGGQN